MGVSLCDVVLMMVLVLRCRIRDFTRETAGPGREEVWRSNTYGVYVIFCCDSLVVRADVDVAQVRRSYYTLLPLCLVSWRGVAWRGVCVLQIILSMAAFAQTSPEKSFAIAHAAAGARRRAEHEKPLNEVRVYFGVANDAMSISLGMEAGG